MTTRKQILASLMLLAGLPLFAQTTDWLVRPEYSRMSYFAPGMYKVKANGKYGVIDKEGKTVLEPKYDSIDPFYNGVAIFGNEEGQNFVVAGMISDEGEVTFIRDKFYIIPDYPVFSEGYMPVMNARGLYGYIDEKGNPAFEFTKDVTRPFVEGTASVGEGDDFCWLTTDGEKYSMYLSDGSVPWGCSNFYDGAAYVWNDEGRIFRIGDDGRTVRIDKDEIYVDYLYRAYSDHKLEDDYTIYKPTPDDNWTPKSQNGYWTYVDRHGRTLSPYKYDEAKRFTDGVAMASQNGKWGLLHLVAEDEGSFAADVRKRSHNYNPGKSVECEFSLSVPQKWRGRNYHVDVIDIPTGQKLQVNSSGKNRYRFSYSPEGRQGKDEHQFRVVVADNNSTIWGSDLEYEFNKVDQPVAQPAKKQAPLRASIRVNNAEANRNNQCIVTATVYNPSSEAVTTTVTLSGGGQKSAFANRSVTLRIPAHGSKSVTSAFVVRKVELGGWCSVKVSSGSGMSKKNLQLKPF